MGPLTITSLTANRTFPFVADGTTSITWTATATGGIPPIEFEFLRQNLTTGVWTTVQAFGPSATFTWTPASSDAGAYQMAVLARNAGSTQADASLFGAGFNITAVPVPLAITGLNADVTFPVPVGTVITWTATTTGGIAPLRYQFWRQDLVTGIWTTVQDGASATFTWTPAVAGPTEMAVLVWNAGSAAADASFYGLGFNITP